MTASYAQQNMNSFTAQCSESSSARKSAAYSFITVVMGIAAAMSFIIISSVVSVRVFSVVLLAIIIIALLVILTKPKQNSPRG